MLVSGVAVIAAGYALNYRELDTSRSAVVFLTALSSNVRFLTFVAIPLALTGAAIAVRKENTPLRLIRHGSRTMLLFSPLWRLTSDLAIVAATVGLVWVGVALSTGAVFGSLVSILQVVAMIGGATALLAVGLAIWYWLLLGVGFLTDSTLAVGSTATLLWLLVVLPSVGVFMEPHPLNAAQYVTLRTVSGSPRLVATLFLTATLIFLVCRLVARWRDSGVDSPRLRGSEISAALVVILGLAGAVGLAHGYPTPRGVLSLFFLGAGSSLTAYLLGMTTVLCLAVGATTRFAVDWTTRSALLRIRYGTTERWVLRALAYESRWVVRVLLVFAGVMVCARYAATGEYPVGQIGSELLLLTRVLLVSILVVALLMTSVIFFGSEVSPLVLAGVVLALGIIPALNRPWNPLLAWSATWGGDDAIIATVSVAMAILAFTSLLAAISYFNHGSKAHLVSHQS